MNRRKLHIKASLIGTLFLAIYALLPCDVKVPLFNALDVEYNRPLNKNKTVVTGNNGCAIDFSNELQATKTKPEGNFSFIILPGENVALDSGQTENHSFYFSSNSSGHIESNPPMYILYKRLKFDMAPPA